MSDKLNRTVNIAVIPGDGIGKEVIPEGMRALERAGSKLGVTFHWTEFDWSCKTYHRTGRMMPENGISQLKSFDAIYLGAVGFPGVPDHVSLWGLLIPIRREFDQYVNLRPVRLFTGVPCPLANKKPGDIDFYVVEDRIPWIYPWMNELGGDIMPPWNTQEQRIASTIFSNTCFGHVNTTAVS